MDLACSGKQFSKEIILEPIRKALINEIIYKTDDYTNICGFEGDFYYSNYKVNMDRPFGLKFLSSVDEKSDLIELIRNKK